LQQLLLPPSLLSVPSSATALLTTWCVALLDITLCHFLLRQHLQHWEMVLLLLLLLLLLLVRVLLLSIRRHQLQRLRRFRCVMLVVQASCSVYWVKSMLRLLLTTHKQLHCWHLQHFWLPSLLLPGLPGLSLLSWVAAVGCCWYCHHPQKEGAARAQNSSRYCSAAAAAAGQLALMVQ
jgi:hypothetical protein